MHLVAYPGIRTDAAKAEAIDVLDPYAITGRSARAGNQFFNSARLARFCATNLDDGSRVGLGLEIVVETDHTVHFGAAEIEAFGNDGFGSRIDTAECRLDFVKNGKKRSF